MMSGLISFRLSYPKPHRSRTPFAKFSLTTSDTSISRVRSSLPRSVRRFSVIPCLSVLWLLNPPPISIPRRSSTKGGSPRRMSQRP